MRSVAKSAPPKRIKSMAIKISVELKSYNGILKKLERKDVDERLQKAVDAKTGFGSRKYFLEPAIFLGFSKADYCRVNGCRCLLMTVNVPRLKSRLPYQTSFEEAMRNTLMKLVAKEKNVEVVSKFLYTLEESSSIMRSKL